MIATLAMYFNVIVLCFLLYRYLNAPVRKIMAERIEQIKNSLESARRGKEEALAFKADYERLFKNSAKEREEILNQTYIIAKKRADQVLNDARKEATSLRTKAEEEIQEEREKASDDVRNQIIELSTSIASRIVEASIDNKAQEKYFNEALADWSEQRWQA